MTDQEQTNENNKAAQEYTAQGIQVLKGLEAVRKRPAMYIGDTGLRGLHHLVYEVVDNSIDEAMAGYCTEITVVLENDDVIKVHDNGRGIPVDMHKTEGKPALEVVLTSLHAGGKFDKGSYKVSGGLHGVGVSCVNALSVWTKAEVHRDGQVYFMEFHRGDPVEEMKNLGASSLGQTGTIISFKPDDQIFPEREFNYLHELHLWVAKTRTELDEAEAAQLKENARINHESNSVDIFKQRW